MTTQVITFHPPYLRYDEPADLSQIQDRIENLREKAFAYQRHSGLTLGSATLSAGVGRVQAEQPLTSATPRQPPVVTRAPISRVPSDLKTGEHTAAVNPSAKAEAIPDNRKALDPSVVSKAKQLEVNVSPSGLVTMGFNCKAKFQATNNFKCLFTYWDIFFQDPSTGAYTLGGQYLGETYFPNHRADEIDFEIDWGTYSEPAYIAADGTATFVIKCRNVLQPEAAQSAEIVLNFNAPPCIDLHSVSLNENTFVGGKNGDDPTLTVVLNAPAPPGGQRIFLSVSDTHKAGILGNHFFDIPAGQISGQISGFLGTESVSHDRTVDILVDAGGPITGHATVYLHKK